jgi:hypothetical protein
MKRGGAVTSAVAAPIARQGMQRSPAQQKLSVQRVVTDREPRRHRGDLLIAIRLQHQARKAVVPLSNGANEASDAELRQLHQRSCALDPLAAHDRYWHECDIARSRMDVRFRGKSGRAADITGTTEFDPGCVKTHTSAKCRKYNS